MASQQSQIVADKTTRKFPVGIPIKLLHESIGFVCTVETKSGALYRGKVINVEDSFNVHMQNVQHTGANGTKTTVDNAYIRGSQVLFIILPDMLKNSANLQPRQVAAQIRDHDKQRASAASEVPAAKRQRV